MIGKSLAASRSSNRDYKKTLEGDSITMNNESSNKPGQPMIFHKIKD